MLDLLHKAKLALPELLSADNMSWNSLRVDYHKPYVDRLWRQLDDDHRVLLHCIHPCKPGEALLHPHPWPSAVKVYNTGHLGYETGVGWGNPLSPAPAVAAKFVLYAESEYEMTAIESWHYVRPVGDPVFSLMVIGRPYFDGVVKDERFGAKAEHKELTYVQRVDILAFFRDRYLTPPR